ncbi:hypothetical protein C8Q77DRAFT_685225 [Trametes polyzona]|nr:hypothetical protein C8Q77DRAFT_685225 [Trametes polyzona]
MHHHLTLTLASRREMSELTRTALHSSATHAPHRPGPSSKPPLHGCVRAPCLCVPVRAERMLCLAATVSATMPASSAQSGTHPFLSPESTVADAGQSTFELSRPPPADTIQHPACRKNGNLMSDERSFPRCRERGTLAPPTYTRRSTPSAPIRIPRCFWLRTDRTRNLPLPRQGLSAAARLGEICRRYAAAIPPRPQILVSGLRLLTS